MPQAEIELLHEHLDGCSVCQKLVLDAVRGSAFAATNPDDGAPTTDWNTTFRRGELVGQRYRIQRFIARGGMGEVYEAFDRDLTERVALKTVASTACDNPTAVRRLKAEVQLARRVSHTNVCRIYDLGSHLLPNRGAQIHFLTMEFVDGRTLGQRLRSKKRLSLTEAMNIARQLLMGLSAAHEAGILHRDFKSDNVMLRTERDGRVTAVILDFGLARSVNDRARASQSNQQVVGTLGYIAPEQLHGKPFTMASDLYSFGVVFYEMLTGERPFAEFKLSPHAAKIRAPSRLNPEVPAALDALVLGCLRASPARRFKNSREVLERLDRIVLHRPPRRSRRSFIGVALGTVVIGALSGWAFHSSRPEPVHKARPRASEATPPVLLQPPPTASIATHAGIAPVAPSANRRVKPAPRALPSRITASAAPALQVATLDAGVTTAPIPSSDPAAPTIAKPRWENPFAPRAAQSTE